MAAKSERNPRRYREMSTPFATPAEAEAAIEAFEAGAGALREQHRLANVYVIMQVTVASEGGEEHDVISTMAWGDMLRMEGLTAWACGHEAARRAEAIAKALGAGRRHGSSPG